MTAMGNWTGGNRCGGGMQAPPMQQWPQQQWQQPQWGGGMTMGGPWGWGGWNQMPWMQQQMPPQQGGWRNPGFNGNNGYSPQWNQGVNQLQQNGVIPFNTGQYRPQTMPQSMPAGHNNLFDYARSTGALRGLFG